MAWDEEALLSGEAWRAYCERLGALGERILGEGFPEAPRERAEGFRWLTRLMTYATRMELEAGDPHYPRFVRYETPDTQWGGPNPDNLYLRASIDPCQTYRVWANATDVRQAIFSLHEGDMQLEQYGVPSYQRHMANADHRPAYRYHRRFLQKLQQHGAGRRWLLKAPSHQAQLRALFDVYPDARIIRTHRDPLKSFPSMLDLMGTLLWMRCNSVDLEPVARAIPANFARLYRREIEDRASGALPGDQFIDVQFADIVRDPVSTIGELYARLGWDYPGATREAIATYARNNPKGSRGTHRYSAEGTGLDPAKETERFRFYMQHYGIRAESPVEAS